MITVELEKNSLNQFKKHLEEIKDVIQDKGLNLYRAKSFKSFTKKIVSEGGARLVPLSPVTIALAGIHNPEFVNGKLMDAMKVESQGSSAIAGYWEPSAKVPGKNITYAHLALIQSTGYRIPIDGPKGSKGFKVRAWLAMNGFSAGMSSKKRTVRGVVGGSKWLIVPPRPFMEKVLARYLEEDGDSKAASEYIENALKKKVL